jgi:hypothetical protein
MERTASGREAVLMVHLATLFPADILPVLALNQGMGTFLAHGGEPLRGKPKESYDLQIVSTLLNQYALYPAHLFVAIGPAFHACPG